MKWQDRDQTRAAQEGWRVEHDIFRFLIGPSRIRVRKIPIEAMRPHDWPQTDAEAEKLVGDKAAAGSHFHRKTLAYIAWATISRG